MNITAIIARQLGLREKQVESTINLLEQGATIPFISRYRKEATGGLNEVQVAQVKEQNDKLNELVHRREYILQTIEEQGKLTEELKKRIEDCWDATLLEDIYLPFKPKRKTKAEVARKKGLEPLANTLLLQPYKNPEEVARQYVKGEVKDVEEALQGARDILAERFNEDERTRQVVRRSFEYTAMIRSKVVKSKEAEAGKFRDYFDWSEPLKRCTSHRLLAMRRGEAEGFLRVSITPSDEDDCISRVERPFVKAGSPASQHVIMAATDAYKRLLKPSIETEFAGSSKTRADEEAIQVFANNLKQLLLTPPLGQKRIMGIDPGFRTGCKVVCLDAQGTLLHFEAIYPHAPKDDRTGAARQVLAMAKKYEVEAVAVGNGTASRETSAFLKEIGLSPDINVFVVSEDGASVYSASEAAREEFPDEDVTVRGAVSIGRRLMDPLAELVKIDPKSIGVGQYQHDVDQSELKKSLDMVVESCVNTVGVNLNTASRHLLMYVSGLNATTAKNIVEYREKNGAFKSRAELKKVPRLGPVAFVQCAGFLRIPGSKNPLDNSAVHPESYDIVKAMAKDKGCTVAELIDNKELQKTIRLKDYVTETVGMPTLTDIMAELQRPGRDPRAAVEAFEFDSRVHEIDDLQVGMLLPGIVTNITNFGAFVDVGVHHDGLVHISQLSDRYVKDPNEVVKLHQHVVVRVTEVDKKRQRISLSMKE